MEGGTGIMRSDELSKTRWRQVVVRPFAAILLVAVMTVVMNVGQATSFVNLPALRTDDAHESLLLHVASNSERILAVGEQGHILYSDDDGANWNHAEVPVSLAITGVTFASPTSAWATAHDGVLLHSTDGGQTWQMQLSSTEVARLSATAAEKTVENLQAAVDQASDDVLEELQWALDDATFAFEDALAAIEEGVTSPLLDVRFVDEQHGYVLGSYGMMLHTADGGATWTSQSDQLDNPEKFHLYSMARSASGALLVVGESGTLLRSPDGGENWVRPESPYSGSFFGAVAASDGGLLAFGLRGNVFRSVDDGDTWEPVSTGDQRTLLGGMTRADGTIILVGSAGAVLSSADNGASFRIIPTTGNRVYSSVTETTDGNLLLVGFGGVSYIDGQD